MKQHLIAILSSVIFVHSFGLTDSSANRVDQRQAKQTARINKGIASGRINDREAKRLNRQQGRIQAAEKRMSADGTLTPQETKRLRRMQNRASRKITRKNHNLRKTETPEAPPAALEPAAGQSQP